MNSRAMRRLAGDHSALHSQPLPPNYLFPPGVSTGDDLAQLDILLAGPTHTPFAAGVFKLHLTIPTTYPQQPPTANFRTSIFHPNVDPQTGGVCVETLKRDWDSKLTLKDVLVTISCLLIQPNPDSALNAEAGALIQEDYTSFAKRAELMTSIQASIPRNLLDAVREAQRRGQDIGTVVHEDDVDSSKSMEAAAPPARRSRPQPPRQRRTVRSRRSDESPSDAPARSRRHYTSNNPFLIHPTEEDPMESLTGSQNASGKTVEDDDSSMIDENQENDESRSPVKTHAPKAPIPRRPLGAPMPLGELTLDDTPSSDADELSEHEYPPSPRKSPRKSAVNRQAPHANIAEALGRPESSRTAAARARDITPANNVVFKPLAHNSPFVDSSFVEPEPLPSSRRKKGGLFTSGMARAPLFGPLDTPRNNGGIFKRRSPSSSEKKREDERRKREFQSRLWDLCGRDVGRWNRGNFDGEPFSVKTKRW